MKRFFNTTGPCSPEKHYTISSETRCNGIMDLVENEQYFVIHAARQSGKTTLLMELVNQLNSTGTYYALYCSLENIQEINDPEKGIPAIVRNLKAEVRFNKAMKGYSFAEKADYSDFNNILRVELTELCSSLYKPLVILFDEVDCLSNGTMITFLRQLREGYVNRSRYPFVNSAVLTGMRNIRDYKVKIRQDRESLGSASPFNIVKRSMTIENFTQKQIEQLYQQHTQQTGQKFPQDVTEEVYYYTKGQPWLVNAIACEIVEDILKKDYSKEITRLLVQQAVQNIIIRRDTHIDSLLERLKEKRVQKIIEPAIIGEKRKYDMLDDDLQYVLDLGLTVLESEKLVPSNPIYAEIIIKFLSYQSYTGMIDMDYPPKAPAYLTEGKLDMKQLLTDFQQFWRENSEIWEDEYQYKEAAPHLILQAFLQRVINAGGHITREFGAGRGRLDLCVHYKGYKYPVELKIRYDLKTYEKGKTQISDYMDRMGCKQGWLIVFDRRKTVSWEDKIFWESEDIDSKVINIVGC